MLRPTPLRTRLAGFLLAALLLPACGCFYSRRAADVDRNPTVDTGMGASIIMPGQSAPAMGGAAGSGEGDVPSATPNLRMIGGSEIDQERHETGKEDPLLFKALTAPLAVIAAPFAAAAEAMRGDPEPGPQVPAHKPERPEASHAPPPVDSESRQGASAEPTHARPAPPGATRAAVQPGAQPLDYESREIEAMERELERRRAASGRAPSPAPSPRSATPAPGGSFSIADELASLQRTPQEPRRSPHSVPAPLEGATPPDRDAAGTVADGIVDRDEDGRIDMWLYRQDGDIVRKVLDQDFDGRPDTTLLYDPTTHRLTRVEEDGDHDGATDSWTDYRDGEVARRRVDGDRDGEVDTWTFYRNGEISRHEQDTTGDGFRDRIGHYESGRLVREEQDRNGDGRPDLTEYYDAAGRVSRRDEDRDHDGTVDVISHYENGRLARREIRDDGATALP